MRRAVLLALGLALVGVAWSAPSCPPAPPVLRPEQAQALAARAPDRGLLWRLQRGGQTSYLYGSLHLGRVEWAFPGPALQAAWRETDALAVELDPADVGPALAQRAPPPPLPPALARRLAAQVRAACLPEGALAAWPPALQVATLTLLAARHDGFDASFGQDVVLMARARIEGRPVLALESVDEQLMALEPEPGEDARRLVESGLRQLETQRLRAPLRRLALAWSAGQLDVLADYPRWCGCADSPAEQAWLRRLNDERNPHLAARISALHGAGQSLLVVVGALHMSGPQALPRLLAEQGFDVQLLVGRTTK